MADDSVWAEPVIKATVEVPAAATESDLAIQATMAEEPIEHRLRRAWLNGFKEGVERSAYATVEVTGRWDY